MKGEIGNEITLRDRDSIWQEDTADHVTGSPTKNSRLGVEVATERIKASRSAHKQLPALFRDTRETRSGRYWCWIWGTVQEIWLNLGGTGVNPG